MDECAVSSTSTALGSASAKEEGGSFEKEGIEEQSAEENKNGEKSKSSITKRRISSSPEQFDPQPLKIPRKDPDAYTIGGRVSKQKPQFLSYEQLVYLALKNANYYTLMMSQVYAFIMTTFPCFRPNDTYWRANVDRAVILGKIMGTFETTLTARCIDIGKETVSIIESKIEEFDGKIREWCAHFDKNNIEGSRFSTAEEMTLVCEGQMGFVPPPPEGNTQANPSLRKKPGDLIVALRRVIGEGEDHVEEDSFEEDAPCPEVIVTKRRGFPCKYCTLSNRQLRAHMREIHGFSEDAINLYRKELKKEKKSGTGYMGIDCPKCHAYLSIDYIKIHLRNVHNMSEEAICVYFPKRMNSWRHLIPRPESESVDSIFDNDRSSGSESQEEDKAQDVVPYEDQPMYIVKEEILDDEFPTSAEPVEMRDVFSPAPELPPLSEGGVHALQLLAGDDEEEGVSGEDVKPNKEELDAELAMGMLPRQRRSNLPDPDSIQRTPAGHCMVCRKRVGRKSVTNHLRSQHGFTDEDVLQYMLTDQKRNLNCPGCTRLFKSHLSLTLHNRWCPPKGNTIVLAPPEDSKPEMCIVVGTQGPVAS